MSTPTPPPDSPSVFTSYTTHCSAPRIATDLILSTLLKKQYPNLHISQYNPTTANLPGYAAAGHATCTLVSPDEFTSTLTYYPATTRLGVRVEGEETVSSAPGGRVNGPIGRLEDNIAFAQYEYSWQGTTFRLFTIVTPQNQRFGYVCAPRSDADSEVRSRATESLLLDAGRWTYEVHDEIYVFDMGTWGKSAELYQSVLGAGWDDVILDPATKNGLMEDVSGFFDSRDLYTEFGVPWKRGIILHGLPGNGKTISIKALMAELMRREEAVPSLYVKSLEGFNGQQGSIRNIFVKARSMAPCLLIFEDLDSLITERTRSYFLNEVDGLEKNDGILMLGSTNHLDKLDSAIRDRPSRFDRKYFFKLPGWGERVAYAQYWREKLAKSQRVEFPEGACKVIASMTDGFSFAYLKELFVASLLVIARGGKGGDMQPELSTPESGVVVPGPAEVDDDPVKVRSDGKSEDEIRDVDEKIEAARSRRAAVKNVEVPEELKDSVLVKVVRSQIHILLEEMDSNVAPARDRVPKSGPAGQQGGAAPRVQLASKAVRYGV